MTNNNIPRWNLDSIFSSIQSSEYKNALNDFQSGIKNLENLIASAKKILETSKENFDFPLWLKTFLQEDEKTHSLSITLSAYSYIIYSVDTTNTDFLNNISKIDDLNLLYQQVDLSFKAILLKNKEKLNDFYQVFPEFQSYKFLLEESLEESQHQMSPEEEELAGQLQKTAGDAWDRLHEQIISNLKDSDGKTFNELRNDAYSADANLRKSSWQKEIKLLKDNEIAIAASLNNLKGETLTLNKKRHWNSPIERALSSCRMTEATLDALISSIQDSLPLWRNYFTAKGAYLKKQGLTASSLNEEGLAFYDLFAPLTSNEPSKEKDSLLSRQWSFDEAKNYIIERYSSFSQNMGNFAKKAFSQGWIDAQVRPGKVGGAYDEDFPLGHQSRIMTNFTGAFSDIITLAHELGHAFHFSCMKGKPSTFFQYPMTLAETASTFAETIVKQDMISKCSGSDKLQILDLDLQDVSQVLVDILCRFYFEKSLFEERSQGELNSQDFCRLMAEAQEKSYGWGLNSERHPYMWAVKSHYYSTSLDFYNFPYAFGQLFAAGLYAKYKEDSQNFPNFYEELLSNTGNMSCEDLCLKAGFDITKKDFWKNGIQIYAKEVEEFVKMTKRFK